MTNWEPESMDAERLDVLLNLYFDEALDSETKQELERMLLSSPRAREVFWERAKLNSMLRQLGQESWGHDRLLSDSATTPQSSSAPTPTETPRRHWGWGWSLVTAACCLLVASAALWLFSGSMQAPEVVVLRPGANASETRSQRDLPKGPVWVAVLHKTVDVQWPDGESPLSAGEAIPARRIQFDSGLVEIQTNRGALIALEGPADLEIVSGMEVFCRKGRLRVDVPPPAEGFLVSTPLVDVVDRGTSFAMNVNGDEATEVHVLEGMVELVSETPNVPNRELREGESIGLTGGAYQDITSNVATFPSAAQVRSSSQAANTRLRQAWNRRRNAIAGDPSCFLYFDFEESTNGETTLVNKAVDAEPTTNGTIVGGEWADGRWPDKKALEFKSVFDRVLFSVPGEHETLTCLASVRLDAVDSELTSLLMPCDNVEGAFRWQISRANQDYSGGELELARRSRADWDSISYYFGEPCFRHERLGAWIQVAFVWDGTNSVCSQYIDGTLVSRDRLRGQDSSALRIEQMVIGNSTPDARDAFSPLHRLNGRIDEFAMFNRALSEEEINVYHDLTKVTWSNRGRDGDWNNAANWHEGLKPETLEAAYINLAGENAAVFSEGTSVNMNAFRVGSSDGLTGELKITGGTFTATRHTIARSRVGVAGGHGRVSQLNGNVALNALQVALDPGSEGTYHLEGGELTISRGIDSKVGSLDIGAIGATGTFDMTGGSLMTRNGVTLGRLGGVGTFSVQGSGPANIAIGSHGTRDGFWMQHSGSELRVRVDRQGLTPIFIDEVDGDETEDTNGNVTFERDALLDVDFLDAARSGSWDVMSWEGQLTDRGLRLADGVDRNVWSFDFVDTDSSGEPDTLRVTATHTAD